MSERTCNTCHWQNRENRMWCNNCELNNRIAQWPHADNFDFWQRKEKVLPQAIDSTALPSETVAEKQKESKIHLQNNGMLGV